jgi:hypothetical protein
MRFQGVHPSRGRTPLDAMTAPERLALVAISYVQTIGGLPERIWTPGVADGSGNRT